MHLADLLQGFQVLMLAFLVSYDRFDVFEGEVLL